MLIDRQRLKRIVHRLPQPHVRTQTALHDGIHPRFHEVHARDVPLGEQTAREHDVPFKAIHIQGREEAQCAPTPITTYALFCDGAYLTNEQMNEARFLKLLSGRR